MNADNYYILIHQSLTGQITKADQTLLNEWLKKPANQETYEQLRFIWENPPAESDINIDHFLIQRDRLDENLRLAQTEELKKYRSSLLYRNVAILFLVIITFTIGVAWVVTTKTKNLNVAYNGQTLRLTDGTKITLNKAAKVVYGQTENERHLQFEGEAFFEVARDESKPFVVSLPKGSVKVLGTSFFIRAYSKDTAEVIVVSGTVEVISTTSTVALKKGEASMITPNGHIMKLNQSAIQNYNAWYTGKLEFENTKLRKIISLLESEYHVSFRVVDEDLLSCRFTGTFDNESIDQVLNIISQIMNFKYRLEGGVYIIEGSGCANTK